MKGQFVPYELAVKLKELGFDEECLASYYIAGRKLDISEYINNGEYTILAPLWQQAFDYLLNKSESSYSIQYWKDGSGQIELLYDKDLCISFDNRQACLEKLIELVTDRK